MRLPPLAFAAACVFLVVSVSSAVSAEGPADAPAAETLDGLRARFEAQEQEALKLVRRQYLSALEAHLARQVEGADREEAYLVLLQTALNLGERAKVYALGDLYFKEFPKGEAGTEVLRLQFLAKISDPQGLSEGAAILERLEEFRLETGDLLAYWHSLAAAHLEFDDIEGAGKVYNTILNFSFVKENRQASDYFSDQKASLEEIGKPFEDFDEKSLDGKMVSASLYRGKVVLIDFWATWCQPCMQELPGLVEGYRRYQPQGFEIIGISLDQEDRKGDLPNLRQVIRRKKVTWPQIADGQGWQSQLAEKYKIRSIPATYLLDRQGRIYRKGLRGKALWDAVNKLLAQPAEK
ncbi:MAG: TlpA family protein disulfide reductase [Planctomycetes bacterium]|nr:TlpA family protein disulfide reductase [Planctomycetota bacterium]